MLTDAELLGEEDTLADADRDAESLGGGSVIVAVLDPDVEDVSVDVEVGDEDRVKETVAVYDATAECEGEPVPERDTDEDRVPVELTD